MQAPLRLVGARGRGKISRPEPAHQYCSLQHHQLHVLSGVSSSEELLLQQATFTGTKQAYCVLGTRPWPKHPPTLLHSIRLWLWLHGPCSSSIPLSSSHFSPCKLSSCSYQSSQPVSHQVSNHLGYLAPSLGSWGLPVTRAIVLRGAWGQAALSPVTCAQRHRNCVHPTWAFKAPTAACCPSIRAPLPLSSEPGPPERVREEPLRILPLCVT